MLTIEICPNEPRAMFACDATEHWDDILDCTRSGDAQEACDYIRDQIGVRFCIIARDASGTYENREATDDEISATARAIYFESETDFDDVDHARSYLIWEAANSEIG